MATAIAASVITLAAATGCEPRTTVPAAQPAASAAVSDTAAPTSPAPTVPPASTPTTPGATTAPPVADGDCAGTPGPVPAARVTEVKLSHPVVGYGRESDTEALPLAIAARPGGSWLAWLGTDSRVYLGKLDCDDKLVGEATSFAGIDLQDVQADATGGVLLLTRKGTCGTGPLCGGSSSPCNTMHMIRFDNSGAQQWEQQVTNLGAGRDGYDDGARFVWWYQHHGRLATDGTNYAAYFGVAITVKNGACVDVHEGDRMQVVDARGALVDGHRDSFAVGCSHSWNARIVWDPRTSRFVMVCATDNGCRIAQPNPYRTVAKGTCDGTLFGGDLVLAKTSGYWTAWSQGGKARLDHFSTGASDRSVTTSAATSHPHLVSYGPDRMLLTWQAGSAMAAQVHDADSGAAVGDEFTIPVRDHDFQAFKAYPDGSAAYPAAGSDSTSVTIARVLPMS
jgi:hypothetical protein